MMLRSGCLLFLIFLSGASRGMISFHEENCMAGHFNARFTVAYNKSQELGNGTQERTVHYVLPESAVASVNCWWDTSLKKLQITRVARLRISWGNGKDNVLELSWQHFPYKKEVTVKNALYTFLRDKERFPNATDLGEKISVVLSHNDTWSFNYETEFWECDTDTVLWKENNTWISMRNVSLMVFDTKSDKKDVHCKADSDKSKHTRLYNGTDENGTTLALVDTHVRFTVAYNTSDKKSETTEFSTGKSKDYNVSATRTDNNTIVMTVNFPSPHEAEGKQVQRGVWNLTFVKSKDGKKTTFSSSTLYFNISEAFGFNKHAENYGSNYTASWLVNETIASGNKSWHCKALINRNTTVDDEMNVGLWLTDSQIQAFLESWDFAKDYEVCAADKPKPAPAEGEWNVTEQKNNWTCIMLKSGIVLNFKYRTSENATKSSGLIEVPKNATVTKASTCRGILVKEGNSTISMQELVLNFWNGWNLAINFTNSTRFTKVTDGDYWVAYQIALKADLSKKFPDANPKEQIFQNEVNITTGNGGLSSLMAKKDHSWVCKKGYNESVSENFNIDFADVQLQAYTNSTVFKPAEHCKADQKTSDLIPIIVGACLAALVVIVLVAYLIGRARARREAGYQSV